MCILSLTDINVDAKLKDCYLLCLVNLNNRIAFSPLFFFKKKRHRLQEDGGFIKQSHGSSSACIGKKEHRTYCQIAEEYASIHQVYDSNRRTVFGLG